MTAAQMMTQANFVSATTANSPDTPSWDFVGTWMMYGGLTDPLLSGFMTPLTVTANNTTRIYGQGNPAFGESYSVTPSSNLFGAVSYSGTAQTATNVGSYVIAPSGLYSNQGGYILNYVSGTLTINPAALTVTGQSVGDKVYDGMVNAVLTGGNISGELPGDGILLLTQAGNFAAKDVGGNLPVTASDSVAGASAGNYTLTEPTGMTASITPASLTVTGQSAGGKVYDGTLNAVLIGGHLIGEIAGDGILLLTQAGSFVAKDVGSNLPVTANDSVAGARAGNYTLTEPTGLTANITPASLTVNGSVASNKIYDGTLNAVLTGGSLNGEIAGDGILQLTQAGSFVAKNVGSNLAVTGSDSVGGSSAGNYTLTEPIGLTASIAPAMLTYTAAAANYTIGQPPSALSGLLSGFVLADSQENATAGILVWTTPAVAGSQAGRYAVDGGGLTAANYMFVEAPGDAIALTLQSGSSLVIPSAIPTVIPTVIPPVIPPVISPAIAPVITSRSRPDATTLVQAQTAAGTLLPRVTQNIVSAQIADADQGAICSQVSSNDIVIDKGIIINAMVPSLRIVCGGVKLPDNRVDANAL
jgi:hypothetical protein